MERSSLSLNQIFGNQNASHFVITVYLIQSFVHFVNEKNVKISKKWLKFFLICERRGMEVFLTDNFYDSILDKTRHWNGIFQEMFCVGSSFVDAIISPSSVLWKQSICQKYSVHKEKLFSWEDKQEDFMDEVEGK